MNMSTLIRNKQRDDKPQNTDPYGNSDSTFFHPFPRRSCIVRCFILTVFLFFVFCFSLIFFLREALRRGCRWGSTMLRGHRTDQRTRCFETASLLVLLCKGESTLNVETFPIPGCAGAEVSV